MPKIKQKVARLAVIIPALVLAPAQALAQDSAYKESSTKDGQDIVFQDDALGALAGEPVGAQITGFHPPRRFALIRPRTTFVPQMLRSVEAL
jgi:hypothetical protein